MRKGTMAADARTAGTKGSVHKLRREGRVPGVIYGAGAAPVALSVSEKELNAALKGGIRVLEVKVGSEGTMALLKDVDYDHLGERIIHVDFQRIVKGAAVEVRVPVVFKGTPVGLKEGGVFNVLHDTLLVSCQPEDVPDHVEVDITSFAMGQALHAKEIVLPKGVSNAELPDAVIAVVTYSDKEVETVAAVPEEATAAQPEVIGEAERKAREEAKAAEDAAAGGAKKEDKKAAKEEKK